MTLLGIIACKHGHPPAAGSRTERMTTQTIDTAQPRTRSSEPEPQPAIKASGVRRTFGETVALDGVDVEVMPGEIYGFLGPNEIGRAHV